MVDYEALSDPNAEYTMRDLSAETMGATRERGGVRDAEITDIQTTMVDGNYPWILVRVYTDAGVVGTGESYWGGGDARSSSGWRRSSSARTPSTSIGSTSTSSRR